MGREPLTRTDVHESDAMAWLVTPFNTRMRFPPPFLPLHKALAALPLGKSHRPRKLGS